MPLLLIGLLLAICTIGMHAPATHHPSGHAASDTQAATQIPAEHATSETLPAPGADDGHPAPVPADCPHCGADSSTVMTTCVMAMVVVFLALIGGPTWSTLLRSRQRLTAVLRRTVARATTPPSLHLLCISRT